LSCTRLKAIILGFSLGVEDSRAIHRALDFQRAVVAAQDAAHRRAIHSLYNDCLQLAVQDAAFLIHVKEGLPFLVHEQVAIGLCGNSGVKLSGLVLVKEDPGAVQGKLCVEDATNIQDAKVLILLFHESLKASKLACHNVAFVSHKVEELPNLEASKALLGLL